MSQVHIRADVLTKTIGKSSRDEKKPCGGGALPPRAQRKKTTIVDEAKECFSENDLCYGDDYDYEDDEDEDDDEEDGCGGGDEDDDDEDADDAVGRRGGRHGADSGVRERKNGSAVHCDGRRQRNVRRGGNCRTTAQGGGRRQPKTAASDNASRRRRAARQDKTAMKPDTAAAAVQRELAAYLATNVPRADPVSGDDDNGNGDGDVRRGNDQLRQRSDVPRGEVSPGDRYTE